MDCSLPGSSVHGDSPGKNTGVGCHSLLQGIFPTQGLNLDLLHYRRVLYHWATREARGQTWTYSSGSRVLIIRSPGKSFNLFLVFLVFCDIMCLGFWWPFFFYLSLYIILIFILWLIKIILWFFFWAVSLWGIFLKVELSKIQCSGTSLVVQWLGTFTLGAQVQSLVSDLRSQSWVGHG